MPPLIAVVLVPRVGGLGTKFFSGSAVEQKARVSTPPTGSGCGAQGVCETSRYDVAQAWGQRLIPLAFGPGRRRRPWRSLLRDGDLIPRSMTIALLAYLPRIVHFLVLKWCPHPSLWS